MKTGQVVAIGAGVIGLSLLTNRLKSTTISNSDRTQLEGVLDGEIKPKTVLSNDTSPLAFTIPSSGLTAPQRAQLIQVITSKYSSQAEVIAGHMSASVSSVFAGISALIEATPGSFSIASTELYFKCLEVWAARLDSAVASVTMGVAKIISDANANPTYKECTSYTFIKEIYESSTVTETNTFTTNFSNKKKTAVFGLFGAKSADSSYTAVKSLVTDSNRVIKFIPLCTDWDVDPNLLEASLASQQIGIVAQYAILKAIINTAPNPIDFTRP